MDAPLGHTLHSPVLLSRKLPDEQLVHVVMFPSDAHDEHLYGHSWHVMDPVVR